MNYEIHHTECIEYMKTVPDNYFDSVVTDPPYGLGNKEPDIEKVLLAWLNGSEEKANDKDFMGKDWQIPSPKVWREC